MLLWAETSKTIRAAFLMESQGETCLGSRWLGSSFPVRLLLHPPSFVGAVIVGECSFPPTNCPLSTGPSVGPPTGHS